MCIFFLGLESDRKKITEKITFRKAARGLKNQRNIRRRRKMSKNKRKICKMQENESNPTHSTQKGKVTYFLKKTHTIKNEKQRDDKEQQLPNTTKHFGKKAKPLEIAEMSSCVRYI